MGDILGLDFLTNPRITESNGGDIRMPDLGAIDLPAFNLDVREDDAPRIMPKLDSVGPMQTSDGLQNLNADSYLGAQQPSQSRRMSDETSLKEKYELLRKFERLAKQGVPMRKRFTLESPIEEMRLELEFVKREKDADASIKQFCDWFVSGMGGMEWASKNVAIVKAFGLELDGLSESAQMNVGDLEDDFEELYDMYGDKLRLHPLVRIPLNTCRMIYMVHLTNQMVKKSPIPNMDQILRTNPDIARQLATAAMQQQAQPGRAHAQPAMPPPPSYAANPLAGLSSYMNSMVPPPPPQQTNVRPQPPASIRGPVRIQKPNPQPPAARVAPPPPARDMGAPPTNIEDLLRSVNAGASSDAKSVTLRPPTPRRGPGSTGKNSVSIKL